MDLDELVQNIEKARDAASKDADDFAQEAKRSDNEFDALAADIKKVSAQAVEAALNRILGEAN